MLPDKLSDLLELAVRDVTKCEAEPKRFRLDMGNWHKPDAGRGVCVVCMAGSIMAQTLGVPDSEERSVFQGMPCVADIEPHRASFNAVNEMRVSKIRDAAKYLGLKLSVAQLKAAREAENTIRAGLPTAQFDDEERDGEPDDVSDWDNVNDTNFHAPWPVYLEAAAILREAGL